MTDVPSEGSIIVPFFGREVHVYRADQMIKAVSNTCLHFGGPLNCEQGKFVCPWHGATFDMATGERESGPSPKTSRLMFVSIKEQDGAVYYVWGE